MNRRETTALTVQIQQALAEELDKLSGHIQRPTDWIVEQALVLWMSRQAEDEQLIREALDDVDAGRIVDHSVVQAWVDSLDTDNPQKMPL
ncbi:CopG family transcriptional regulator [Pseudoduganella sp. LjRoot289]|uniref:CopG family ribbon-helix-helix protein n=1 Tax=Pseudoduganella sp. LjRoot289 TaxID=3342314 RepID=UPI003ECDC97F